MLLVWREGVSTIKFFQTCPNGEKSKIKCCIFSNFIVELYNHEVSVISCDLGLILTAWNLSNFSMKYFVSRQIFSRSVSKVFLNSFTLICDSTYSIFYHSSPILDILNKPIKLEVMIFTWYLPCFYASFLLNVFTLIFRTIHKSGEDSTPNSKKILSR